VNKTPRLTGRPKDVITASILWLIGLAFCDPEEIKISTIGAIKKRVTVSIKPVTINIRELPMKSKGYSLKIRRKKIKAFILLG
jgi:hypothetical protein